MARLTWPGNALPDASQGRLTLLLGPPSSGKSTLLRLLAGSLTPREARQQGLELRGAITYNGEKLDRFQVRAAGNAPLPLAPTRAFCGASRRRPRREGRRRGRRLGRSAPQVRRTASMVEQVDNHLAELTVRETFDFAAASLGAGTAHRECRREPLGFGPAGPHDPTWCNASPPPSVCVVT